jgi:threonine synthase
MALRLALKEGLFAGTSTGANVIAALRLAEKLSPDATIVTVMCDTGMKYLKTYGNYIADILGGLGKVRSMTPLLKTILVLLVASQFRACHRP